MKISYNWLKKYFDESLPEPEKLAELFTAHVFEIEELQKVGDDFIYDTKPLPDRAHYLLCHRGVAREASVITGIKTKEMDIFPVDVSGDTSININIINTDLCRRYVAREISGINVSESPDWLKISLESVGQKSINNLVDAGNFVMLDVGQPLHIFDADKVMGDITIRLANQGEKIVLLTGDEVELNNSDLVITDEEGPIAIAGVKGGKRAGVTNETKRIIIESANFDPTAIRRTSTRLNLRNDASKRFENEITPELADEAMERITALIADFNPGADIRNSIDVYPSPVKPWSVSVSRNYINSIVGIDIPLEFMQQTLTRMGCKVELSGDKLVVTPPYGRYDLQIPEDIADEIARIWGYEKLDSKLPPALEDIMLPDKSFFYSEKTKNILIDRGYSEVLLYSLVKNGSNEILYPMSEDKSALRNNLSNKFDEVLTMNGRNSDLLALEEVVKIFEIGKVFPAEGEHLSLALGVLQTKKKKGVTSENILEEDMKVLQKNIGMNFDYKILSKGNIAICEINFDKIVSKLPPQDSLESLGFISLPDNKKYEPFSVYPFITRDIAIFVPEDMEEDNIKEIIKSHAGPLCTQVRLFDVFEKDGRKSLAYRLIFQSYEKTLTDDEVEEEMKRVNKALEDAGAEIR